MVTGLSALVLGKTGNSGCEDKSRRRRERQVYQDQASGPQLSSLRPTIDLKPADLCWVALGVRIKIGVAGRGYGPTASWLKTASMKELRLRA